jgi:hypothetical protein
MRNKADKPAKEKKATGRPRCPKRQAKLAAQRLVKDAIAKVEAETPVRHDFPHEEKTQALMSLPFPDPDVEPDLWAYNVPIYTKKEKGSARSANGQQLPIEESHPLTARSVLELSKLSVGHVEVSILVGVSKMVVRSLRMRHASVCSKWREKLHGKVVTLATMALERITNELDELSVDKLPILAGIMLDKASSFSSISPNSGENDQSGANTTNIQMIFNQLPGQKLDKEQGEKVLDV